MSSELTSVVSYKNTWKSFNLNDEFWREVLVGRKITSVLFDKEGVTTLVLDSGEQVFVDRTGSRGGIYINQKE